MHDYRAVNMPRPGDAIAEIPSSCTCTWECGPSGHWNRIGPKEDCPWHTYERPILRRQPEEHFPEWLDDDVHWRRDTLGERPDL